MNTELLKSKLLEAAFNGSLTHADTSKREGTTVGEVADVKGGKRIPAGTKVQKEPTAHIYIRVTDMKNNTIVDDDIRYITDELHEGIKRYTISKNDLYLTIAGTIGRVGIVPAKFDGMNLTENAVKLTNLKIEKLYLMYFLASYGVQRQIQMLIHQMAQPKLSIINIKSIPIQYPNVEEQQKIVSAIEEGFAAIDAIAEAKENLSSTAEMLRSKILQQAIQGKLVPQDENDEPASVLLESVHQCRESLIKEKKVKPKDIASEPIAEDERPFELPAKWEFVRLNYVAMIARGGSPRPIKDYLTDSPNGYDWIKIGDTEKGGKYINKTQERIKPEGLKKSRLIHKGDFLLTNSMSFGRPYISNIEGCIHDGWLVISPSFGEVFDKDYLYYVLSSPYAKDQFLGKVSGAVVQNLNSDKVATSIIPLPPLAEQKRIVAKIEELFAEIDKMKV